VEGENGGRPCLYRLQVRGKLRHTIFIHFYEFLRGYTSLKRRCRLVVSENYSLITTLYKNIKTTYLDIL
jgi:hypothetical protein